MSSRIWLFRLLYARPTLDTHSTAPSHISRPISLFGLSSSSRFGFKRIHLYDIVVVLGPHTRAAAPAARILEIGCTNNHRPHEVVYSPLLLLLLFSVSLLADLIRSYIESCRTWKTEVEIESESNRRRLPSLCSFSLCFLFFFNNGVLI